MFTNEGTKGWMVGPISQSWIEDKLRCWSGFTFTQQGPQYSWAWIAVQTVLQDPFPGRREQTNTGEVVPLALGAHTVGTELWGVTSCSQPGQCSRGLSCCFWCAVRRLFACCLGPWTLAQNTQSDGGGSFLLHRRSCCYSKGQHQARSRAKAAASQLSNSVKPCVSLGEICWVNTLQYWK